MGDKPRAATPLLTGLGANDAHDPAVELEFHIGVRQETRPLTDLSRDGHLAFGSDAHGCLLTLAWMSKEPAVEVQGSAAYRPAASLRR